MESARCGRRKQRNPRRKNEKAAGCGNKHCLGCDGQLTAKKAHHLAHDKTTSPDGKHKKRTKPIGLPVVATSSSGLHGSPSSSVRLPGKTSLHRRTTGPAALHGRTSRLACVPERTCSAAFTVHGSSAGLPGKTSSSAALSRLTSSSAGAHRTSDSVGLHGKSSSSADLHIRTLSSAGIHGKTTSFADLPVKTTNSATLLRKATNSAGLSDKTSNSAGLPGRTTNSAVLPGKTTNSAGKTANSAGLSGKTSNSAGSPRRTTNSAGKTTNSDGLPGRTTNLAGLLEKTTNSAGKTTNSAGKTTSSAVLPGKTTNSASLFGKTTSTVLPGKTTVAAGLPGKAVSSPGLNRKTSIISAVLIVRTKIPPVRTVNSAGLHGEAASFAGLHGKAASSVGLHGKAASSVGLHGKAASSVGLHGKAASSVGLHGMAASYSCDGGAAKEIIERKKREKLEKKEAIVENGLESEDTDETKLDDNKNEIDDDLHSSDLCSSSCSDIENQKDDGFHDISGCEIEALGETEAGKQHTKSDTETTIKNIINHEKLIHVEVSAPDSTTSDKDRPETDTELVKTKTSEAERIAEYLTRGDTAVIFPEPVRDDQDTHIDEDAEEEEIILKCMHCPQTFLRVILLRDHMREVHPDKPLKFMCPKCDETFHQKSQLDKHLTLHSPTSQNCNICNKTFANVYRLQRHMISHDESTDLRKFKCHECGKAFKFKHHLKEHIRIHSGEKPFECANCGKRFSHSGSYSSHMTSKKCWVVSAHKGRIPPDSSQTGHNSMVPATTSPSQSTSQMNKSFVSMATNMQAFQNGSLPFPHASLPSVPVTHPLQQHLFTNPFIPQKTGIPTFYPPHLYRNPGFMSHPVFSMSQTQAMHLPQGLGLQTLPGMKLDQTYDQRNKERSSSSPHRLLTAQPPVNTTHTVSPLSSSNVPLQESQKTVLLTPPSPVSTVSQILPSLIPTTLPSSESEKSVPIPSMQKSPESLQNQSSTVSSSFSQSISSVSPSSTSTTSFSEQISPDINSNTKLIIPNYKVLTAEVRGTDLKKKEDDIPKKSDAETVTSETTPTAADLPEKNSVPDYGKADQENEEREKSESVEKSESRLTCRYCSEKFDTPVAQLQHEEFTCLKRDRSMNKESTEEKVTCKYCSESFDSPVAQHQHERYICKQNKDIVLRMSQVDSRQSPHSTMSDSSHTDVTPNGSVGADTDDEDGEEMYKDSDITADDRKLRIRSLFTDEQLNILKAQYLINPRPRKFELIRIGNKIGFPKRVVQVWFQNMRARDRKHGKDLPWSIGPIKTEAQDTELSKSPTYIPNVPQPFIHKLNGQPPAHVQAPSKMPGESPLDLSVRRTPPIAHGGSMSRMSTPDSGHDSEVLNLSMKRTIDGEIKKENSATSVSSSPVPQFPVSQPAGSFKDSAIFKYMQQEGMILQNKKYDLPMRRSLSPSLAHILQNQYLTQTVASVLSSQASSSGFDKNTSSVNHSGSMLFETPRIFNKEDRNSLLSKDESSKDSSSRGSTPLSSHETSSVTSSHGRYPNMEMQEDTHNLATLAEAAQHAANILSGKPKRLRKKTWRQMESEEVQLDFDDSMSNDEDTPLKKKRKSWKGHRVDRDEGLYACDQCNKMFNKQSSLARHKYEHSGARPFACDMCPKSFKHKHHLTEHKRLHSGEKPFVCKKCGKRFSHSGSFSQHMNHRYNYCSPHKMSDGECDVSSQGSP